MKTKTIISAIAVALAFASCKNEEQPKTATPADNAAVALMEERFTTTAPAEFVTIEEARKVAPGEKTTVKATLLGREKIFADGGAMFMIGDPDHIEIEENESKPWIACCTAPEIKKLHTMTVQFLDKDGKLIMTGAKGVKGLKELDEVIISGTMDASSTEEAPIINIDSIYIAKEATHKTGNSVSHEGHDHADCDCGHDHSHDGHDHNH